MKKGIPHILSLTFLLTFISCESQLPLSEYEPKNQAEQEIKALIIEFLDCRNKHDIDCLFAFFRSDAEVMHGHGANREHVTKKEARETWPELLQSFPTVEYYNPKMEITENNAVVYYEITTDGFESIP